LTKTALIHTVSCFNLGEQQHKCVWKLCLGGAKSTKAPPRGDGTGSGR